MAHFLKTSMNEMKWVELLDRLNRSIVTIFAYSNLAQRCFFLKWNKMQEKFFNVFCVSSLSAASWLSSRDRVSSQSCSSCSTLNRMFKNKLITAASILSWSRRRSPGKICQIQNLTSSAAAARKKPDTNHENILPWSVSSLWNSSSDCFVVFISMLTQS